MQSYLLFIQGHRELKETATSKLIRETVMSEIEPAEKAGVEDRDVIEEEILHNTTRLLQTSELLAKIDNNSHPCKLLVNFEGHHCKYLAQKSRDGSALSRNKELLMV